MDSCLVILDNYVRFKGKKNPLFSVYKSIIQNTKNNYENLVSMAHRPVGRWRGLFQKLQHSCISLMYDCAGVFVSSHSMLWCMGFPPRHTFLPSGSMKITETRISDSGMYLCVATNIAGNVTQSVKLSVHGEYWKDDLGSFVCCPQWSPFACEPLCCV